MSDCVIVQPIAEGGLALLRAAGYSVHVAAAPTLDAMREHLADARAVITRDRGFSGEAIAAAPRLVVIASHGTGVDAIDREAAKRRGITVVATPGTNAPSVAEHTMALILAAAKALPAADAAVRRGDTLWRDAPHGCELAGRTLALVGYGRIARRVARLGQAFGMSVAAISTVSSEDEMARDGVESVADLDTLVAAADVISLHTVPDGTTLFDVARLARLRPDAILVNTARGALIDEDALAAALREGRLGAAALDVTVVEPLPATSALFDAPNLILTPHVAAATPAARERTACAVAQRVIDALEGR